MIPNPTRNMKAILVGLHSFALVAADLAGIGIGGGVAYHITGKPNQVWLQLPLAVVLSAVFFCAWILLLRAAGLKRLQPLPAQLGPCLVCSLLLAPLIFVPLHYFTQGYLTSIGNLLALAFYQLPVNVVAFSASLVMWRLKPSTVAKYSA